MRIDNKNREALLDLPIRDSRVEELSYDYEQRQIMFSCKNFFSQKRYVFSFHNVIFSSMQSCSIHYGTVRIFGVCLSESCTELLKLTGFKSSNPDWYKGSYLDRGIEYLPIKFQINDSDILTIICQSLDVHEESLDI